MSDKRKKIICIGGATASGKSALAEKISCQRNGKIISADSRQVYKNIPIFSGISESEKENFLVAFLDEEKKFSAGDFTDLANDEMKDIWEAGKIPVVVGGTSFYFKSLLYQDFIPKVSQDPKLRKELSDKSAEELMEILADLDAQRAKIIDPKNKPRIIRSIEIAKKLGKVPVFIEKVKENLDIEFLWIHVDSDIQKEKIRKNFKVRMDRGFLKEAENLKNIFEKKGMDGLEIEKRFSEIGLAYKHIFKFWNGDISEFEFLELGILEEQKYAKRQNTYLKKFFRELPDSVSKEKYT